MHVKQIKLSKMAVCCYLVADEATGECAFIDPAFDTDRLLGTAAQARLKVTRIINTHCHADHTAGNAAMKKATGADICIHRADAQRLTALTNSAFARVLGGRGSPRADVLLEDADSVTIGDSALTVLHTPGHTPGGVCLYAHGHLFTGDTLFVGGIGRTDLPGGSPDQLIASIRRKIYPLPGDTVIWPGHDYGFRPSSTVAREMKTNPYTQ